MATAAKKNNPDKWILVSCLQKSVRKGYVDLALNYAEQLYDMERAYLLYRLSIIAVEDVGLGNIDVVHDFMSTEIKKAQIEERGGKDYVLNVVEDLASSNKDRSACDLTYLAGFYEGVNKNTEDKSLEQLFLSNDVSVVKRLLAGWQVLGTKRQKNPFVQKEEDDLERFIELNSKLTSNQKILEIMRSAYKFHREPHFIALGLLDYLYNNELKAGGKVGNFNIGETMNKTYTPQMCGYNNKWLIDGFDWHTAEGKKAIFEFCKTDNELIRYLRANTKPIDEENFAHGVGTLLFRENGHCVNARLIYPSAVEILKVCITKSVQLRFGENVKPSQAMMLMSKESELMYKIIEEQRKVYKRSLMPF